MAQNDTSQGIESADDGLEDKAAENKILDKTVDKIHDKAVDKIHDKTVDKIDDKAVDKIHDKADDKINDKADDKTDEANNNTIPEWESFSVAMNTLIKLTEHGYNKEPIEASKSLLEKVIDELDNLESLFVELERSKKSLMEEYCEKIISHDQNFVATLNSFMATVYKCLTNGYELKALIKWTIVVTICTQCSQEMRKLIIKEGVHIQLLVKLIDLPHASTTHQEILADLMHLSMLAILLLTQHKEFRRHFKYCNYTDILISYLPSQNFSIGKLAKVSLSFLHRHLDKAKAEKYLTLSARDVRIILKLLSNQELTEEEKKEFWGPFSHDGLIIMLQNFCHLQKNSDLVVQQNIFDILANLIGDAGDNDTLEAILLFLWKLASSCHGDLSKAFAVIDKLQKLDWTDKKELKSLFTCACYALEKSIPESTDDCLLYVEKAYEHELYEECIELCEKVPEEAATKDRLALFHGKSLYNIFTQELESLKNTPTTSRVYSDARLGCYKKIKKTIQLLGLAFDNKNIDDDGGRMLDVAMMVYLSESRNLTGKLPRCLLCYKKGKLAKSHICPRSILDNFAKASGAPDSGKAFFLSWPWQKMYTGTLKSAGEMTIRVLCHDCETILSKSESKFLPNFFCQLYNLEVPDSIVREHNIEYQDWLHQFCVGLIFRGMTLQYSGGRDEFVNEDEVHSLLLQCRNALLHPGSNNVPKVSIFIAPTKGDPSEVDSSLINVSIHLPFHFFFTQKKYMYASHQLYLDAFSYTFQIGMILTNVQLSKAAWPEDPSFTIHPNGGVYKILHDSERRHTIPDYLWESLLAEAVAVEKEVMEQPRKAIALQPLDDLLSVPSVSYMTSIFDITQQSQGMGKGSKVAGHPKVMNFMPDGYEVFHSTAKAANCTVSLPPSHRILLHATCSLDGTEKGSTAFIAVGHSPPIYTLETPYLIFHQYEPGLQGNTAFFFSTENFEYVQYLPEPNPKRFLGNAATTDLIKKSSEIVSLVLKSRGFRNYQSLSYWAKSKKGPVSFDMNCGKDCWYCCNLCEICLEQAILGPSLTIANGRTLKFCSKECFKFYETTPEPHSLVFAPDVQVNAAVQVPDGHKEHVRLYTNGKFEDSSCLITSLSLCEGDGSADFPLSTYYLKYHMQTLKYQCHYEYFVNDTLEPLHSVKYTGSQMDLFDEEECDDIKQSSIDIIRGIFTRSGLSTVSQFFEVSRKKKLLMENPDSFFLFDSSASSSASAPPENARTHTDEQAEIQVFTIDEIIGALLAQGIDEATISKLLGNIVTSSEMPLINTAADSDDIHVSELSSSEQRETVNGDKVVEDDPS